MIALSLLLVSLSENNQIFKCQNCLLDLDTLYFRFLRSTFWNSIKRHLVSASPLRSVGATGIYFCSRNSPSD